MYTYLHASGIDRGDRRYGQPGRREAVQLRPGRDDGGTARAGNAEAPQQPLQGLRV